MKPVVRRLYTFVAAMGTFWVLSPLHVLASGNDSVENMFKQPSKPATGSAAVPSAGTGDGSMLMTLVQLVFALGIIIAIIYLLIRLLSNRTQMSRGQAFQSFGAHALTTNRSVHMVAVGSKLYVLGVGENVTLLDTITDPQVIAELQGAAPSESQGPISGWQELMNRFRPKTANPQSEEIVVEELPFDAALREKLQQLKERQQPEEGQGPNR